MAGGSPIADISDKAYTTAGLKPPSKKFKALVSELPMMENKTVAITGTTTGTGKVFAFVLLCKGARVICLNRPSERAEQRHSCFVASLRELGVS